MTLAAPLPVLNPPPTSGLPLTIMPPWLVGLPRCAMGRPLTMIEGKPATITAQHAQTSPTLAIPDELASTSPEAVIIGVGICPGIGQTCRSPWRAVGIIRGPLVHHGTPAQCRGDDAKGDAQDNLSDRSENDAGNPDRGWQTLSKISRDDPFYPITMLFGAIQGSIDGAQQALEAFMVTGGGFGQPCAESDSQ